MVLPDSDGVSPAPPYSGILNSSQLTATGLSPFIAEFPNPFAFVSIRISGPYNPEFAVTNPVWASSRSLATTWEITKLFSSPAGT